MTTTAHMVTTDTGLIFQHLSVFVYYRISRQREKRPMVGSCRTEWGCRQGGGGKNYIIMVDIMKNSGIDT